MLGTIYRGGEGRGGEGAVGCQPICAPILSRLIKEGRRHEPSAVGLSRGGSGGMPPRNIFEFGVSEMPFSGLWGKI
jgi:hypothetical protein